MAGRIPITILSGYLGAGKTTILNAVLAQPHGQRLAVLVNDFGPVNVDAGLIRAEDDKVIELSNGCVCCSIGDDLTETLSTIATWSDPPDRLLLEASGVAEPQRVAQTAGFWPGFELDAVIVAADAEAVRARAQDKFIGPLIRSQIRSADIVALTKGDLIGPEATAAARNWLRTVDPMMRLVEAPGGALPAEVLFGPAIGGRRPVTSSLAPLHPAFSTVVWRPAGPVDPDALRAALADLPPTVHRAKGVVADGRSGDGLLVQCVGTRCEFSPAPQPADSCLVLLEAGDGTALTLALAALDGCLDPV